MILITMGTKRKKKIIMTTRHFANQSSGKEDINEKIER